LAKEVEPDFLHIIKIDNPALLNRVGEVKKLFLLDCFLSNIVFFLIHTN